MGNDAGKFIKRTAQIVSPVIGSAWASQDAADAQGAIAQAQLDQQRTDRAAARSAAEPSPQELEQLNRAIQLNESDIQRKERLIASSDPAIIEAGTQALQLLRGAEAKSLGPLKSQLAKQEQTLRQRLQTQLGSGYENTTAGIQALNAFNEQANNSISTAQQQTLNQLLGVAQDTSSRYGAQSNIANAGTFSQLYGNQASRQVAAINGTPISAAGAQFVGDLQSARGVQDTLNQYLRGAGIAIGAANGLPSLGSSPTANQNSSLPLGQTPQTNYGQSGI